MSFFLLENELAKGMDLGNVAELLKLGSLSPQDQGRPCPGTIQALALHLVRCQCPLAGRWYSETQPGLKHFPGGLVGTPVRLLRLRMSGV